MRGPCSCEVKASSAGMDLLTNYDWQARVANWPQPTEAPLNSLLFDIEQAPQTDAVSPVSSPGVEAEEEKKIPPADQPAAAAKLRTSTPPHNKEAIPSSGSTSVPDSRTHKKDEETVSEAAVPGGTSLPYRTSPADSHQRPVADRGRPGFASQLAPDLQIEESPSLGSLLSVRLGVALATAMLLVVAVGFAIIWRRRER